MKELKTLLQENLEETVPIGAVERCINVLPTVKRPKKLFPLVQLQICSIPWYSHGTMLFSFGLILILSKALDIHSAMCLNSILLAGVGLVLLWHMIVVQSNEMSEIERCCYYSFSEIVCSRCVCFGGLLILFCGVVMLSTSVCMDISFENMILMLLPLTISCAVTLGVLLHLRVEQELFAITIYVLTAIFTSINIASLINPIMWIVMVISISSVIVIFLEIRMILKRSRKYEAYSM